MEREEMRQAVAARDRAYDGMFFYGVKSTGIFCRPSCPSRQPREENLVFFDTAGEALAAGYRPCKRCRPDLPAFDPGGDATEGARQAIDLCYGDETALEQALDGLGMTRRHLRRLFEQRYDLSLGDYLGRVRLEKAKELLGKGRSITDTAYDLGMNSASFIRFFRRAAGMSPRDYIKNGGRETRLCRVPTPVGSLVVEESDAGITSIRFGGPTEQGELAPSGARYLPDAVRQLEEYFAGRRRSFDLPLDLRGTDFQRRVWQALRDIPYGETCSYGQVAASLGSKAAARAVGMANNKNPTLIVVPCHRVVGKDDKLVGYAGGIERKEYLLRLEGSL